MSNDFFDFGFTAVNENELDAVQAAEKDASIGKKDLQERLDKLYESILPLLTNLKNNPEKDYIYWPNRTAKIEEFEKLIKNIYKS